MKHWQYFVTFLFVIGCSKEPAPDDSYFIAINDYSEDIVQEESNVDSGEIFIPALSSDTIVTVTDTLLQVSDLGDSLLLAEDSLLLEIDTVLLAIDSLRPDMIPDCWQFIEIEIRGSLYQSLSVVTDVESDILGAHCVRNLVWEMNPWRGFIAGDTMRIIYTTEDLPRENMVVALQYIPMAGSSNHSFSGYVFTKTGDNWPSTWQSNGSELVKLLNSSPVRTFEEITSVFGEPRGNHIHQGVDYKAPLETPVFSVTGGTVLRTNWNTTYNGYCIELDFGGYSEIFLHLNSVDRAVVAGARIEPGQLVGAVGNSGISTAPHLHYQINGPDDYAIDPYLYFSSHRRTLGSEDMAAFRSHVDLCNSIMEN